MWSNVGATHLVATAAEDPLLQLLAETERNVPLDGLRLRLLVNSQMDLASKLHFGNEATAAVSDCRIDPTNHCLWLLISRLPSGLSHQGGGSFWMCWEALVRRVLIACCRLHAACCALHGCVLYAARLRVATMAVTVQEERMRLAMASRIDEIQSMHR